MKPMWQDLGLTDAGVPRAEEALPHLLKAAKICGDRDLLLRLIREVDFITFELPKKSQSFRAQYYKKNKGCELCGSFNHTTAQHERARDIEP